MTDSEPLPAPPCSSPDPVEAVQVVPHAAPEGEGVHVCLVAAGEVGEAVGGLELVVEQVRHVVVEFTDQREPVLLP